MSLHTLMFGWEYPPRCLGGLGVACQGLVRGLLKNNVKVTLVLPFSGAEEVNEVDIRFPTKEHVEMIQIQSMLLPYDSEESFAERIVSIPRETMHMYGDDLGHAVHLFTETSVAVTEKINPDVIHCHDWMTYDAAVKVSKTKDRPLVAHIHATELDRTHFHPNEWIYQRERSGFKSANRIIAVSQYTKNILVQHYGIDGDKITVVHNGTDETVTQEAPYVPVHHQTDVERPLQSIIPTGKKHPLVLFLGRLTIQKGPRHFLQMAAAVHKFRPDVQFIVAGDGHMLPSLMKEAVHLGLQDCMVFAGKVSGTEARKLFLQADCFVMPSLSEPFGLVALEAVAGKTPVIVSKQSGVSEVLGHAFKVDFWDTEKMADCVLTVLRETPLAHQLMSEAPRILQKLTWGNQAGHVRSIYEDLLRNNPPPMIQA
ncbi:MAG: glycosyltransferase family 4 protein [Candidatus Peregrinibacteria bacterium]